MKHIGKPRPPYNLKNFVFIASRNRSIEKHLKKSHRVSNIHTPAGVRGMDGMNCNRRSCIDEYSRLRRNRENRILDANIDLNILHAVLRELCTVLIIYPFVIVHNIP
jgi:hypothetical protein